MHRLPNLNPQGLVGAVAYTDGQFDDARYNVTLVQSFAETGGVAVNYARVTSCEKSADGKLAAVTVQDQFSGQSFVVRARAFVNATGPFADSIRSMANPDAKPRIRLSKGVHILLPAEMLSSGDAMLIPKTEDGRVLFAIPWMGTCTRRNHRTRSCSWRRTLLNARRSRVFIAASQPIPCSAGEARPSGWRFRRELALY